MKSHSSSFRMTPPGRTSRGFGQIRLDPPPQIPPFSGGGGGGVGNLFNSSWERGVVGCSPASLEDGTIWFQDGDPRNDTLWSEGGGMDCTGRGGLPATEITTDLAIDGSKSLRVWQLPGFFNGTDFRLAYNFPVAQTNVLYSRFYIRWGNNWHWGTSDHKMQIFGHYLGTPAQELYINIRCGQGPDINTGRLTIGNQTADSVWTDNRINRLMVKNNWYCIETKITFGLHGSIECKQDGIPSIFTFDAGSGPTNIMDQPVGYPGTIGYNFFKMDSTYNQGSAITEPMDQYWDKVSISNQDWIGF